MIATEDLAKVCNLLSLSAAIFCLFSDSPYGAAVLIGALVIENMVLRRRLEALEAGR